MTVKDIETERKRLIFRSWHRGTREMDLLLGSFADAHVPGFSAAELAQYEEILNHSDPDLYDWISGRATVPANYINKTLTILLGFRLPASKKS